MQRHFFGCEELKPKLGHEELRLVAIDRAQGAMLAAPVSRKKKSWARK